MKILHPLTLALVVTVLFAVPAVAQTATETGTVNNNIAFGVRGGYTGWNSLSQIHLGGHLKLGELIPNVNFTPNIEAGFGDNATIITVNGDLAYNFTEFVSYPWNLYGGGALSFNYYDQDNIESKTDLGLNALLGMDYVLSSGNEVMVEIRVGVMDSPDFKLTFGYTFF